MLTRADVSAGGRTRGAQKQAACIARFEPIKDHIRQLMRRGIRTHIIADLVGIPYSSLFRYLKKQGMENAE